MKYFRAPWSWSLIVVSLLATGLMIGASFLAAGGLHGFMPVLMLGILIGAALFTIRGYTVVGDTILVHRLLWATRLAWGPIQSAVFDPRALRWSLRLCGNGGLFSFTGWFWSRRLGSYRAFVTDPRRTVIVRYPGRTVVVSPESPEEFMRELKVAA